MKKKKLTYLFFYFSSLIISTTGILFYSTSPAFSQNNLIEEKRETKHSFSYPISGLRTTDDVSIVFYDKNLQKLEEQKVSVTKGLMHVRKTKDRIEIITSYDEKNDLMLTIGKVSKNNTWQISNAYLIYNSGNELTDDFDGEKQILNNVYTDYVSPYHQLCALTNIDGDDPYSDGYTGGWHTYTDKIDTPTSTSEQLELFADNKKYGENGTLSASEIKIVTSNLVQGTNTKKRDGTGRPILHEKIIYTIVGNKIEVQVEATALEPLTLKDYYFLQASTNNYNNGLLVKNDPLFPYEIKDFTKDIWGSSRRNSRVSQIVLSDAANQLILSVDPSFGIGNYQYNPTNSSWFYRNYGKVYFNPISFSEKAPLRMEKGEYFSAKGYYQFIPES
ncbi:hypothetical protein [Enterococcus hirae]|uniref:hypothetical protein n=1 Tax=Enterococcus hirae TaxID=1354 RepID=UPI001A967B31|nr:hypothetical protein [Enterococcus hirae]MBO1090060.1 hypothetical protein [Enterococcus hirae]